MQILLDTHTFYWWFSDPAKLSKRAAALMSRPSNTVLVSPVIGWELSIKVNRGKIDALPLVLEMSRHTQEEGFAELPISIEHAVRAGLLPLHHHDPFDRMLVAQAQFLNVPILSADAVLDQYDVKRLW